MNRMLRYILAIVVGLALIFGVAFALTTGMSIMKLNELERVANNFMTELKNGNEVAAYAYYTPEMQTQMNPEMFAAAFNTVTVDGWNFTARSIEGNRGRLSGTITLSGNEFDTTIRLNDSSGTWRITSFDLPVQ